MEPQVLVYSSHARCNYIHNDWIVQRAMTGNKKLMYLPMSEAARDGDEIGRQAGGYRNFEWFFNYYKMYGLDAFPFYWSSNLRKEDLETFWHLMLTSEVVILGGGNPITGLNRYKSLGAMYNGDWSFFQKMLLERKRKGLLSVGFSAGVDHLCEFLSSCINYEMPVPRGFGICHNIIAFSHFENGREGLLRGAAKDFGNCFIFGLPNDSGIAVYEGFLGSGNIWQAIQFIIDNTWDNPSDQFHIKTRQGVKIQHFYTDGRHWAFSGGDTLVRIQSGDGAYNVSFIAPKQGHILDYWSQTRTDYSNIKEILANH